jgi:glutathione peroxidase
MKNLIIIGISILLLNTGFAQTKKTLYDFKVTTIDGKTYDMSQLKGKKVLIVNTASKCGHTPQYKDLEELYKTYGGPRFEIIGFPANNFLKQEPGTNKEISEFCTSNYGVTFQMMSKISVKGDDIDPLYKWLTEISENGVIDAKVTWNFQKFMIDENGNVVGSVSPKENPKCDKIINWIKNVK